MGRNALRLAVLDVVFVLDPEDHEWDRDWPCASGSKADADEDEIVNPAS